MSLGKLGKDVTREQVYAHLKRLFHNLFEIPEERITLEANLYEDLDIDSIDAVDLMVEAKDLTGRKPGKR